MPCAKGRMNGTNNNGTNNNNNNNNNDEYYGDYPFDYGYYGGYKGYCYCPEQIFEHNCGTNVNLDKMNVQDSVVAAQLTVDTGGYNEDNSHKHDRSASNAQLKISFSCYLNYTTTLNEEMDILFKLYRQDCNGRRIELTSIPYNVSFYGDLTTTDEEVTETVPLQLSKNESFYTEYFDEVKGGGMYTYIMEVTMVYNSVDSSSIQAGYISATGQINRGCHR